MLRVYQLDPRHAHLLEDHWSGYLWIQPLKQAVKYKGRVVFVDDLAKVLAVSTKRQANKRRLYPWLITFKKVGYVFRNVNFIKLHQCAEPSVEDLDATIKAKAEEVARQKSDARLTSLRKRMGPDYKPKPKYVVKDPGSRRDQKLWVWAFENRKLNLRFTHIYSFVEYEYSEKASDYPDGTMRVKLVFVGLRIGKSRHEFADYYGLKYKSLQRLASGKTDKYKGWTRVGDPQRVSRQEARDMKSEMEQSKNSGQA